MRFFERFSRKADHDSSQVTKTLSGEAIDTSRNFEDQTKLANAEAELSQEQLLQQERQERKLIGALHGDINAMKLHDVNISEQDRSAIYEKLANGEITTSDKSALIRRIVTLFDRSPERTMDSLDSKHELRILAHLSGTGFKYWESASIYDLQNVFEKFPTPYELANTEKTFLDDIREHNSPQKYAEYEQAMDDFKHKIYGKRLEYYNTLESLQAKADQQHSTQNARTEVLNALSQNTEKLATPPIELKTLNSTEQHEIIQNSQIDGDNFIYNGQAYQLTPDLLEQNGLAPNYSFQLKNAEINLSNPFQVGSHTAVTAYIRTDKGTKVCSYYRSNSQGNWRLLPDYVSNVYNEQNPLNWYGKGYNEESLNLPSETQSVLESITQKHSKINLNPINAAFYFAGTAKRYNSREEYAAVKAQHALRGEHYQEVDETPKFNLGYISMQKVAPESLDLSDPNAPDFQKTEDSYITNTNLYGQIQVEHIKSENNDLKYTFNRDSSGRAWIGGIEINQAPISSLGLRTAWASAGDYGTPLYEHIRQSDGYGDPTDNKGNYISMWANYLSRMPIIQKYLASRQNNK